MFIVNELSSTIDLQSTLIQAESLFNRFRRTVEMLDHKNESFPAPRTLRQRKPLDSSSQKSASKIPDAAGDIVEHQNNDDHNDSNVDEARGAEGGHGTSRADVNQGGSSNIGGGAQKRRVDVAKDRRSSADKENGPAKKVVITPELRALLGRERRW